MVTEQRQKDPKTGRNRTCPLKPGPEREVCHDHCGWFDRELEQCSIITIATYVQQLAV